jgi:ribonuclease D
MDDRVIPLRGDVAPVLVADGGALEALADAVAREPVVGLDTESNSFHVYRERVCLMQLSTPESDYVVDPLAVDVRPLGPALAGREVVLHGADYDVRCLKREFSWSFPRLFDTMAAARRLGATQLGLAALVEAHCGVKLAKEHQRSDWGRRPLSKEQVRYAALDTHFLLEIHERLRGELEARGLGEAARQEFDRIAAAEPRPKVFDAEGWRRLKSARGLDPAGREVLRALWIARERRASEIDRPPFKVLGEQAMVEIARKRPGSAEALGRIPGVTSNVLRRMGDAILLAMRQTG